MQSLAHIELATIGDRRADPWAVARRLSGGRRSPALPLAMALSVLVHAAAVWVLLQARLPPAPAEPPPIPVELVAVAAPGAAVAPAPAAETTPPPARAAEPPPAAPPQTTAAPTALPQARPLAETAPSLAELPPPLPRERPPERLATAIPPAPAKLTAHRPDAPPPQPQAAPATPTTPAPALAMIAPHAPTAPTLTTGEREALAGQYAERLHTLIAEHRIYPPQSLLHGEQGTVTLRIVVAGNGQLLDVRPAAAAPSRLVSASLAAVQAAAPLPPLPVALGAARQTFEVAVVYKIE